METMKKVTEGAARLRKMYEQPHVEVISAKYAQILSVSSELGDDATESARSRFLDFDDEE